MLKRLLASLRSPRGSSVAEAPVPDRPALSVEWILARLARTAFYTSLDRDELRRLRDTRTADVEDTLRAAERLLRHEFDLLGSGPFVPADPDRAGQQGRPGYRPIDWYLDPVRALRFPRGVPYKDWKLYEMRPGNADVKYPWELARCQHWIVLGQAFLLSGDERFAREIADELDDFVEANPVGVGINWTCTMDVALRAVSWAIGLELIHGCQAIDHERWTAAYTALFDHGVFIRGNLENTYEVTSNHFLSNVVGLWFLGAAFADVPQGREWTAFAKTALEQEIDVQILPDGADFESSIPYHRLVAELFLGSSRLADYRGEPLSAHYRSRVRDMVTYLAAVTRPDGLMPQVGDADDGRLHVLAGYGTTTPQDGRHVLGAAGAMYDEPEWTRLSGAVASWEAAWWGFGARQKTNPAAGAGRDTATASRVFSDAGVAIMRAGPHYLLVTNGIVGTKGFGNHKHNDQLSFEFHPDGIPLVVDPGSFVYTSDGAARNRFRGTAYHSTIAIDGVEQNQMNPEWLFRLFESAKAEHRSFDDNAQAVEYSGVHHGYERLTDPVTHERSFRLDKGSGSLEISDRLGGRGEHDVVWRFHLAPGVDARQANAETVSLSLPGRRWELRFPPGLAMTVEPVEYSPSYGVAIPSLAVQLAARMSLDGHRTWTFSIASS